MQKIRLYVMSEYESVRRGLAAIFSSENSFCIVGENDCGENSLSGVQAIQPDAILLEQSNTKCAELVVQIKEMCPYTKVFLFINNIVNEGLLSALESGAEGCISKTMLPCHLVKAVELACRADVLCFPGSFRVLLKNYYNNDTHEQGLDEKKEDNCRSYPTDINNYQSMLLTPRENEIYSLIIQNCSNKEIGEKLFISQPTVKSHVSSILRKMGLKNRTQLVLKVRRSDIFNGVVGDGEVDIAQKL